MKTKVVKFRTEHSEDFRVLHRACLAHYALPPAAAAEEERVLSLLRAERHMACHLAFHGDAPVGFATWGFAFPAGAGISLVMKELFVAEHGRRMGVGTALLAAFVEVAEEEGCVRFDWATDGDNAGAQAFYTALGAPKRAKKSVSLPRRDFAGFQARADLAGR